MNWDPTNPSFEDDRGRQEADRLLAATIYLMCCHARNGCPRLACIIARHFELVGRHPEAGDLVRETCRKLATVWESIRRNDERRATVEAQAKGLKTTVH